MVNFNQKKWRQDFAAYVKEKLHWTAARVTRSRVIKNGYYQNQNEYVMSIKEFRVLNSNMDTIIIQYSGDSIVGEDEMYYSDKSFDLVYDYLEKNSIKKIKKYQANKIMDQTLLNNTKIDI